MKLQTAIGGTIRTIRKEQGLTLRQLSTRSIMSLGFLSEVESGHKNPSSDTLEFIAKGLELTTSQLIMEIYKYLEEHNA